MGLAVVQADLYVAVQELSRVHILQCFKELVHNVLLVDFLQDVGSDDRVQVCLHKVENQVDVPVILSL